MDKIKYILKPSAIIIIATMTVVGISHAGSLTPSNTPPTTNFYTLSDVYDKLVSNTSAGNHDISTTTSPASSFRTIAEIYNAIPDTQTLATSSNALPAGINRTNTTLAAIDTDFIASNIKSGVTIFGITGTYTGSGGGASITWQSTSSPFRHCLIDYISDIQTPACWNNPAKGFRDVSKQGARNYCATLQEDGISTSSTPLNMWRLPTKMEFLAAQYDPTVDGTFTSQMSTYWSSEESATPGLYVVVYPYYSYTTATSPEIAPYAVRCVK